MEQPAPATKPPQETYDDALEALVDTGIFSYDDARRRLAGSAEEQAVLTAKLDVPIGGSSLSLRQAAEVLQWYRGSRALGRAAARSTTDRSVTPDSKPLLTIKESAAAMDYLRNKK